MNVRRRVMGGGEGEFQMKAVDLGLPSGLLWAKCNVGATKQEEYGSYFSWGNIDGHVGDYDFSSTNYNSTTGKKLSRNMLPCEDEWDAATYNLGGLWRMPTKEEFQELYDNTDKEWTTINGVNGRKFMKKTDHSVFVFFPAAGWCDGTSLSYRGSYGRYWSSSLYNSSTVYLLSFDSSNVNHQGYTSRYFGFSVRAVRTSQDIDPKLYKPLTFDIEQVFGNGDDSFSFKAAGSTYANKIIRYSKNGSAWTALSSKTSGATSVSVSAGDRIKFIGPSSGTMVPGGSGGQSYFSCSTKQWKISGNIMSIYKADGYESITEITDGYLFRYLFGGNSYLYSAEDLLLPAKTIAAHCYRNMFDSCRGLIIPPKEIAATAVKEDCCFRMFKDCSNLRSIPKMHFTSLNASECCMEMFQGCSVLESADLSNITTINGTNSVKQMFYNCKKLERIDCRNVTALNSSNSFRDWVYGVKATGTFTKHHSTSWTTGTSGIPSGWTVVEV